MALPQGVFQQQLQALAAQGYTLLPTSKFGNNTNHKHCFIHISILSFMPPL